MHRIYLTLFAIICFRISYGQDFQGVIEYSSTYTSHTETMPVELLQERFGTKTTSYFKNGYYLEYCNSQFMSMQLLRAKDETLYYSHEWEPDTLYYSNTNVKPNGKFEYEIIKAADTILNTVCDKLIVNDAQGQKTYYYSSKYSLNPKFYKGVTASNKYEILKLMKAYYLRIVLEYEPFTVDIVATSIEPKRIKKKFFKLPEHLFLKEQ